MSSDSPVRSDSIASSRSWENSTVGTPCRRAHRATGSSVDLSETSIEVGANSSSTSATRHGSRIRR